MICEVKHSYLHYELLLLKILEVFENLKQLFPAKLVTDTVIRNT